VLAIEDSFPKRPFSFHPLGRFTIPDALCQPLSVCLIFENSVAKPLRVGVLVVALAMLVTKLPFGEQSE